ncbi:hypothetical protein BC826DRAFT_1015135 [Russula brevipes]|nr:hypothetical protein BC826DRAFT_1015135 [Russula brevipes]
MSGYEKQPWQTGSGYAAPQGPSGYQQQPPGQPQQAWSQQQYPPQPGSYQPSPSYASQQGGLWISSGGQYDPLRSHSDPIPLPPPQNQYGAPPPGQWPSPPHGGYGPPPPQQQQQHWGPPQGQGGSEKRHSVCFKFTGTSETILNSQMHDPYGKTPFVVSSDKKHTTVRASDGTTLVLIDWDHSSPVMHYQGKKLKCKEWLVWERAKEARVFQHAGKGYQWTQRDDKAYVRISLAFFPLPRADPLASSSHSSSP